MKSLVNGALLIQVLDYPLSVHELTCFVNIDRYEGRTATVDVQSSCLHLWPYRFSGTYWNSSVRF